MSTEVRIAGIVNESIVDGPGIRFVVFSQGCRHNCEGCHNPHTHAFDGGQLIEVDNILEQIRENPMLDGITLSGGEPFEQALVLAELAEKVKALGLNVMTYTGYRYEHLLQNGDDSNGYPKLLQFTDILIDGRFELARRNRLLRFRGSDNQRIIDVQKSLQSGVIVEMEMGDG